MTTSSWYSSGETLHRDKTRLIPFGRPNGTDNRGPKSFDFLGFTIYWCRTQRGSWRVAYKTRCARLRPRLSARLAVSGGSGCVVAASARASPGSASSTYRKRTRSQLPTFECSCGVAECRARQRRSRMVEISTSGSGGGLGSARAPAYSTGSAVTGQGRRGSEDVVSSLGRSSRGGTRRVQHRMPCRGRCSCCQPRRRRHARSSEIK